MNKKSKLLKTPPGSRPFYKKEALFRNMIEKKLSEYFTNWGFFPLEPPMIDYFDIYSKILNDEQKKNCLRFIDRDGELVLLRNDITLFSAKLIAARLKKENTSLRYYYSDQIIRYAKSGTPQEFYQIGCEIVENDFSYQEIEILCILLESLSLLDIQSSILHIGDISFYQKLLLPNIQNDEFEEIINAIRLKDKDKLVSIIYETKLKQSVINDCIKASNFIGNINELKKLKFSPEAEQALIHLKEIGMVLESLGYENNVILDLSELPKLDYYNGIYFSLYAEGIETPVASGGRYDVLFKKLGLSKKAVGFSYWLYPLEKLLSKKRKYEERSQEKIILRDDPLSTFEKAIRMIRNNKKIIMEYDHE